MAKVTLTRYTCDRCKVTEEVNCTETNASANALLGGVKLYTESQVPNNWMLVAVTSGQKQFCPGCAHSYRDWLASGASNG